MNHEDKSAHYTVKTVTDAFELLEDELLLAMPLIISHADCQPPTSTALIDDLPHPFAALAGLKTPKP